MGARICPKCGNGCEPADKFCFLCGTALGGVAAGAAAGGQAGSVAEVRIGEQTEQKPAGFMGLFRGKSKPGSGQK